VAKEIALRGEKGGGKWCLLEVVVGSFDTPPSPSSPSPMDALTQMFLVFAFVVALFFFNRKRPFTGSSTSSSSSAPPPYRRFGLFSLQ